MGWFEVFVYQVPLMDLADDSDNANRHAQEAPHLQRRAKLRVERFTLEVFEQE
jgi:hypothetical protein